MVNRKTVLNIVGIVVLVYTVLFMYGMTVSSFHEADIPNEIQESVNIQLTQCFLNGINPYLTDVAADTMPPGLIYEYGPVYSLITAAIAKVIPCDLILLHYLVSYIATIVSAILGFFIVREHTSTLLPGAFAFLILINCTWRYGYINAVPDTLAFLFVMVAIFLETRKNCKFRELLEVIFVVLAFYTKLYMAFIALPLFIYKLIRDKKAAIRFFVWGMAIMGIVTVAVTVTCPLIWTYTLYFLHGTFGLKGDAAAKSSYVSFDDSSVKNALDVLLFRNTTVPSKGFGYEILQLRSLIGTFLFVFAAFVAGSIELVRKRLKDADGIMTFLFIVVLVSIPVLAYFGTNDGAWLSYYLQMQIPAVILFSTIYLEEKCITLDGLPMTLIVLFYGIMVFFTVYRTSHRLPYYYMDAEQRKTWDEAYNLLDDHIKKGEIYYSPAFSFHAIKNDQYYYNNGLIGQGEKMYNDYLHTDWLRTMFPDAGKVMSNHIEYRKQLREKAIEGDYELIAMIVNPDGTDGAMDVASIEAGPYEYLRDIPVSMSKESFVVRIWVKLAK